MKVFKPIGSKDRLVEIFQNVNKVRLNEGLYEVSSPNLNADSVLNMAFSQLKNNALNVEHSSTQVAGEENYVELLCTDKQGNNITFVFKILSTEGDQEGVFNINSVILNAFSFDSADGEETIDLAEDGLKTFNQQHAQELIDVVSEYADVEEPAETEVQEAIELIDAIKPQSYPFGGSPDDMQTGEGYADQKPTNDAVRVKAPELNQFVQEDLNAVFHTPGPAGAEPLFPQAKELGVTNQYILKDALEDIDVELLDIVPHKEGKYKLIFQFQGRKYAKIIDRNYGNAAKVVNDVEKMLSAGLAMANEVDQPAMKLIQPAPGGATAGGVKQLEERMKLPIVGGVSAGMNEVDIVGEPKPINPSTKSPVDDLPPEKKKVIMDAINNLTVKRGRREYAPSAQEINDEILRMRQMKESGDLEDTDVELKRFYKEKELASQHPEQISTAELEPEEEPIPEVSPQKRDIILQASDNLMARNAKNPNYSPTINEIMDEIDRIEGKKKPIKKVRGASKEGEFYLTEIDVKSPLRIGTEDMEQIFDRIDPNSNIKQQIILAANEFAEMDLGVKRFQIPPEEYKKMLKNLAINLYMNYLESIRSLNEDEEKGDYPDPIGKKFKPKKHYPKKKQKHDTTVKLSEEFEEVNNMPDGPNLSGEKELEQNYEELRTRDTFVTLSDAYLNLLSLSPEFRSDRKIQQALSNLRDMIAQYCQMSDMSSVTPEDVQNFFENTLSEALYEDSGMSLEPKGDEVEQIAQSKEEVGDEIEGGKAEGKSPLEYDPEQILMGMKVELEHTDDPMKAVEIAMDHLEEFPDYYSRLDKMEKDAKAELGGGESSEKSPEDDKEMTDRLLGFKPHNVGDEIENDEEEDEDEKEPDLDESTTVSDQKDRFQSIVNTPRPEVPLTEDLGFSEKDLKDRDPATWHQIQIAKKTLKMPAAMANVMGGMSKEEAKEILRSRGIKFQDDEMTETFREGQASHFDSLLKQWAKRYGVGYEWKFKDVNKFGKKETKSYFVLNLGYDDYRYLADPARLELNKLMSQFNVKFQYPHGTWTPIIA